MKYKIGQETDKGTITGIYLRKIEGELKHLYCINGEFIEESKLKVISTSIDLPKPKFELNEWTSLGMIIGIQLDDNNYSYDVTESGKMVDFFEEDLLLCSEDAFED